MKIRTKRGAIRRRDAIIRQCYRDSAGGLSFGLDMPTLRITWPDRYAELMELKRIFPGLPD